MAPKWSHKSEKQNSAEASDSKRDQQNQCQGWGRGEVNLPPRSEGQEDQIGKEKSSEDRRKRGGIYTQTWWGGGLCDPTASEIFTATGYLDEYVSYVLRIVRDQLPIYFVNAAQRAARPVPVGEGRCGLRSGLSGRRTAGDETTGWSPHIC